MRQWYSMKADDADASTAEIVIYDEIGKSFWGEDTVSAKSFLDDLTALGDVANITLRINSPGGDVFDGVAIHNSIKNHKAKVTAHVDGIAASAASFIAMAADKIVMPANAFLLIHGASGMSWGNAEDMRAVADDLDRIDKSLTATYVSRAKSTTAKVKALMREDRLMDAAEAKSWGFADEVTSEKKMAARFSLRLLPQAAAEKFRAATGEGQGDPPPPALEPEVSEGLPVASPTPPIQEPDAKPPVGDPTNVVNLDAAKQQGMDEHKAYVASVTDLCTLAGMPERVGAYIRASTKIEDVRKELLDLRAKQEIVMPHNPLMGHLPKAAPTASAWAKITDKLNARNNK